MKPAQIFLHLNERKLVIDGETIAIGSRAFDVFVVLARAEGEAVSKDELLRRVWPTTVVEEGNLHVHISALRRALGSYRDLIQTLPGNGYRLVGGACSVSSAEAQPSAKTAAGNLPQKLSPLIGREAELTSLCTLLRDQRLVTLCGPGGMGKTKLAIECARELVSRFPNGVWLCELAPVGDPRLIAGTLARVLGLSAAGPIDMAERVVEGLLHSQSLIVLDNCEHVIHAVASLVERVLRVAPGVRFLLTTREPVRVEGEYVVNIPALSVPPENVAKKDACSFAATRLFVMRMEALGYRAGDSDVEVSAIVRTCRALDGMPLAIELAASRAAALGPSVVVEALHERLGWEDGSKRTPMPRHQTLRATLDWSYQLLHEDEQAALRRLGVFAGSFTLEGAANVIGDPVASRSSAAELVSRLVDKSLVVRVPDEGVNRYQLLETTRAYVSELLAHTGELTRARLAHANYLLSILAEARQEHGHVPQNRWVDKYVVYVDDLRLALDWSFECPSYYRIGAELADAAIHFMFEFSLIEECRKRVDKAIQVKELMKDNSDPMEMRLRAAWAATMTFIEGPSSLTGAAWKIVLKLSRQFEQSDFEARALWGMWTSKLYAGKADAAVALANEFLSVAVSRDDLPNVLMGSRIVGVSMHYAGMHVEAAERLHYVLRTYVHCLHKSQTAGYQVDQAVVANAVLSRIEWMQGNIQNASVRSEQALSDAISGRHVMSLCYVLVEAAIPIAMARQDFGSVETYLERLFTETRRHGLRVWDAWGRCFEAEMALVQGASRKAALAMRPALADLQRTGFTAHFPYFQGCLGLALAMEGACEEGRMVAREAYEQVSEYGAAWCKSELLRILARTMAEDPQCAEANLREAVSCAESQGAWYWWMRCIEDLAGVLTKNGRSEESEALLSLAARSKVVPADRGEFS